MKPMHLILATLAVASLTQPAYANRGGWLEPGHDSVRMGRTVELGSIRMGDENRRFDSDVIDVRNRPMVECNLTHVKFTAMNDNLRILRVEVKYYSGQTDSIDLNDEDDSRFGRDGRWGNGGRRHGRGMRGIYLDKFQSSRWLNLSDVVDGQDSGRCIDQIRVTGIDVPDRNFDRFDRFGGRAATVQVQGLLSPRRHGHGNGRGDGNWRPRPPMHEQPIFIGSMRFTLFKSDNEAFTNTNVITPVRTLVLEGGAYLKHIEVICETGAVCYSERVKDIVSDKRINLPRPMVVKAIRAKGSSGELRVSVIR